MPDMRAREQQARECICFFCSIALGARRSEPHGAPHPPPPPQACLCCPWPARATCQTCRRLRLGCLFYGRVSSHSLARTMKLRDSETRARQEARERPTVMLCCCCCQVFGAAPCVCVCSSMQREMLMGPAGRTYRGSAILTSSLAAKISSIARLFVIVRVRGLGVAASQNDRSTRLRSVCLLARCCALGPIARFWAEE